MKNFIILFFFYVIKLQTATWIEESVSNIISYEKINTNKVFFEDKINTATYYFDKILPRVQSHYLSAVTGSDTMMKANFN